MPPRVLQYYQSELGKISNVNEYMACYLEAFFRVNISLLFSDIFRFNISEASCTEIDIIIYSSLKINMKLYYVDIHVAHERTICRYPAIYRFTVDSNLCQIISGRI